MLKDKVIELLTEGLEQREDLFLIDFTMSAENEVKVIIDGDKGVLVEDCMFISRAIEHNIDRDEYDFSLEVASAGATSPLVNIRQYEKNIGRQLKVITDEGEFTGTLLSVEKGEILLTWKTREPKPIGKGKVTVQKEKNIQIEAILKASVEINF
jgi:ribosome maturation factor RimP